MPYGVPERTHAFIWLFGGDCFFHLLFTVYTIFILVIDTKYIDILLHPRAVIDVGLHAYFEEYLAETERLLADNDQRGFYKHLKGTWG